MILKQLKTERNNNKVGIMLTHNTRKQTLNKYELNINTKLLRSLTDCCTH